eukprot:UN08021
MIRYHHADLKSINAKQQTILHVAIMRDDAIILHQQIFFEQQQQHLKSKLANIKLTSSTTTATTK